MNVTDYIFILSLKYFSFLSVTDQKITEEIFPYLDSESICALIPSVGERLLFNVKFKAELEINQVL